MCAIESGKGICNGDEGHPLFLPENGRFVAYCNVAFRETNRKIIYTLHEFTMFRETQIGVAYAYGGFYCAHPDMPEIFARVTSFKEWILENTSGTQDSNCGTSDSV